MKKTFKTLLVMLFALCMLMTVAQASDVVMTVNGTEYTYHSTGWSAAVKLAESGTETTVKLFADWIADAEKGFVCPDGGTKDGALYVGDGEFTLDLNGFTIDRNSPEDAVSSSVLYVENCTFTLDDTSAAMIGKITGGFAQNGGGIYAEDANLKIRGGNITKNKAQSGGGVFTLDTDSEMNGGRITDNEAVSGGGIYVYYHTFTMNGGFITRNVSTTSGGGVTIAAGTFNMGHFIMNDGHIEENYTSGNGGAICLDIHTEFKMKGGIIRNNTAFKNGGAVHTIYRFNDEFDITSNLDIEGGYIVGNVAQTGNGGGVYWNQSESLYLANCTITGNSAPKGYGGGVYFTELASYLIVGGTVNVTGNTALTDRSDNTSNFFDHSDEDLHIQDCDVKLNTDSKIGISIGSIDVASKYILTENSSYVGVNSEFTSEMANCFFSDDPKYILVKEPDDDHYDLYIDENPNPSITGAPLFTVEVNGEATKDFYDRKDGWAYVLEKSKTSDVKLKLLADWVAGGGYFSYYETGTEEGALCIPDTCTHNITIDLNGYSIDRNLNVATSHGRVIYMDTYGSLTLIDSSEEKTGKITGGYTKNINIYTFGIGGGIYVDYGTLYLKGVSITGNRAEYGAGIYCDDQDDAIVYIQDGTKIYGNTASVSGGGIYMNNGYLYLEDGEITDNNAANGAGIYWDSDNNAYLVGGKIHGNNASDKGDGVYVSNRGYIFLGGDVQITDNNEENLYLYGGYSNISNAKGQDGAPNKPLTGNARIGVSSTRADEEISADNSMFAEGDFRFFYSDDDRYFIRSVYDANGGNHAHKLYINTWGHADARYPRVKTVSVKDSNLLTEAVLDYDTQTITLVAHNTRRNFFERVTLDELIECTYDKDTYYLYETDYMRDLRNPQEYKIMSDNGTYVMCIVKVVPEGGAWADIQESTDSPYKMTVAHGASFKGFNDFGEGWTYAVSQNKPVTVTLFEDWIAPNGNFNYSKGTEDGYFYLDDDAMDITINLNGNTISRDLKSAVSDGYLFLIEGGAKLTITDNSATGNGKITGGYNDGDGGAFYVDYGKLYINGGEIVGNKATNGGAIYSTNEDDSFVYINGGKIHGNTATEEGGAIFMYNGYLYVDGGEISGNTAKHGGGIYWESRDKLCLTGGVIKDNRAEEGAGVYATDWGDMYIGGTIMVINNYKSTTMMSNFYISDTDAYLNNAAGQSEVPNKPLTTGASVYISAVSENFCFSDSNSKFDANSVNYLYPDSTPYRIRSVYNANGGNHTYKLYYDNYINSGNTLPAVNSIEVVNSCVSTLVFNNYNDYATLYIDIKHRDDGSLKNIALSELITATFKHEGTQLVGFNEKRDFTQSQEYTLLASDGTYVIFTIYVEWECAHSSDEEGDGVCDDCGKYITNKFAINRYEKDLLCAVVIVPEAGTYTVMFVDYEGGKLNNIDIVECTLNTGFNAVYQQIRIFKLDKGDKIMLMSGFKPLCKELVVE